MSRWLRPLARVVLLVPPLAIVLSGLIYFRHLWLDVQSNLALIASTTISEFLSAPIRIGSLHLDARDGWATATDVVLGEPRSGRELATIRSIRLRFATLGRKQTPAVSAEVDGFTASLRRGRNGVWNFEEIIRPKEPRAESKLSVDIRLRDGVVRLLDEARPEPLRSRFSVNEAVIALDGSAIRGRASGTGVHTGAYAVEGRYVPGQSALATVRARRLSWSAVSPYLKVKLPVDISAATIAGAALMMGEKLPAGWRLRWSGEASGRADAVRIRGVKRAIRGVMASGKFTNDMVEFDGRGAIAGGRISGRGVVARSSGVGAKEWIIAADILASGADVRAAWETLTAVRPLAVTGAYLVNAHIQGKLAAPTISARSRIAKAQFAGTVLTSLTGTLLYQLGGPLTIPELRARALGGTVVGHLSFTPAGKGAKGSIALFADVRGVHLGQWPAVRRQNLAGVADATIQASGTADNPYVVANISVPALIWRGTNLGQGLARVVMNDGIAVVPTALLAGNLGGMSGSGRINITRKTIDFSVRAGEIQIGRLPITVGGDRSVELAGIGYFDGKISGAYTEPSIWGEVEVYSGRVGDYDAEVITAVVTADAARVRLDSIDVMRRTARIRGVGEIVLAGRRSPALDFDLTVENVATPDIASLLKIDIASSGILSASNVHVGGTVADPEVSGEVALVDIAQIDLFRLDAARAAFVYRDGSVLFPSILVTGEGASIAAVGTRDASGNLDFTFTAGGVPLAKATQYFNRDADMLGEKSVIDLSGRAALSGRLTGTAEKPVVNADTASVTNLAVNGVPIGSGSGQLSYDEESVRASAWQLQSGSMVVRLDNLMYVPADGMLAARAEITAAPIATAVEVARSFDTGLAPEHWERIYRVKGAVDLTFEINGKLRSPDGRLTLSTHELSLDDENVGTLLVDVSRRDGVFALGDPSKRTAGVVWTYKDGRLSASGTIDPEGDIDAATDISGFDLAWLHRFEPSLPAASGLMELSADLTGPTDRPNAYVSVQASNVQYRRFRVDSINVSPLIVREGAVELEDAALTYKGYGARVSGSLPFHWRRFTIPEDEPIRFHVSTRDQPLTIVELLTNKIDKTRTLGTAQASVDVTGTLGEPRLQGTATVKDGVLAFANMEGTLKDIQAALSFNRDAIEVQRLEIVSSRGGAITLAEKGTASLVDFPNGPLDIALNVTDFEFRESRLAEQYQEPVRAQINGRLNLTGVLDDPLITGSFIVSDADITLPTIEPATGRGVALPPIRVDVDALLDNNVTVRNSNLRAVVRGDARLRGTLAMPQFNSSVVVQRGTMNIPGVILAVLPDSTIDIAYNASSAGEPVSRVDLDVRTQTSIVAATPTGGYQRYRIEASIRGPLGDNLNIQATSDPPGLSQQQIVAILTRQEALNTLVMGGDPQKVLGSQISGILTGYALPTLLDPVQQEIALKLGLTDLSFTSDVLEPLAIYASKTLFDGVNLSYRQSLAGSETTWEAKLNYRLPIRQGLLSRLQVGVSYDWQRNSRYTLEASWRF